jgi:hypothetical protein
MKYGIIATLVIASLVGCGTSFPLKRDIDGDGRKDVVYAEKLTDDEGYDISFRSTRRNGSLGPRKKLYWTRVLGYEDAKIERHSRRYRKGSGW